MSELNQGPEVKSSSEVRRLLMKRLRSDEQFDAFCQDCFPDEFLLFGTGMSRLAKTNLLLSYKDPTEVGAAIISYCTPPAEQPASGAGSPLGVGSHTESMAQGSGARAVPPGVTRRRVLLGLGFSMAAPMASYLLVKALRRRSPEPGPDTRLDSTLPPKPRFVLTPESIEQFRLKALRLCEGALDSTKQSLSTLTIAGLGATGDIRHGETLLKVIKSSSSRESQAQAILAIGRLGLRSARPLLAAVQNTAPPEVLAAVVESLYRLAEHQADFATLRKTLQTGLKSPVPVVRERSAFLLAPLDAEAREVLWQFISPQQLARAEQPAIGILWRLCQCNFEPASRMLDRLLDVGNGDIPLIVALAVPQEGWMPSLRMPLQWTRARHILSDAAQREGARRILAARALSWLGLRSQDSTVLTWLRQVVAGEESAELTRQIAIDAMGVCGDASDLSLLHPFVTSQEAESSTLGVAAAVATLRIVSSLPQQLDEQALAREEEERRSGAGSGLLQTMPSLSALGRVLKWLEKSGSPSDAWLLGTVMGKLKRRRVDLTQSRKHIDEWVTKLPPGELASRRIVAALSEDKVVLHRLLSDEDETVRLWTAERMIQLGVATTQVIPVLHSLKQRAARVRASGLLRQVGQKAQLPVDAVELALSSSADERQAVVDALARWPIAETAPYLSRVITDSDPMVRRLLIETLDSQIQQNPTAQEMGAALSIAAQLRGDTDSGVQFRVHHIEGYARQGFSRRQLPPPSQLIAPVLPEVAKTVPVSFRGETGVRFSLNGRQLRVPVRLELAPGRYRVTWIDGVSDVQKEIQIPSGRGFQMTIPVPLARQLTQIVP